MVLKLNAHENHLERLVNTEPGKACEYCWALLAVSKSESGEGPQNLHCLEEITEFLEDSKAAGLGPHWENH